MSRVRNIRENVDEQDQKLIERVRSVWGPNRISTAEEAAFDVRLAERIEQQLIASPWRRWILATTVVSGLLLSLLMVSRLVGEIGMESPPVNSSTAELKMSGNNWADWMEEMFQPQDEKKLVARLGDEYQVLDEVLTPFLEHKR